MQSYVDNVYLLLAKNIETEKTFSIRRANGVNVLSLTKP